MPILTLYWIVASIFLQVVFTMALKEGQDPDERNYDYYKRLILINIVIMITAPLLLPIGLGIHYQEVVMLHDVKMKELKEKKKRLFKDE